MSSLDEDYVRAKVKAELRKRLRGVRQAAPASACSARSSAIVARLLELPEVVQARRVALFFPIEERHEVDLRALHQQLQARGQSTWYPAIDADTRVMTFRRVVDTAELEERGLGFAEPAPDAEEASELDVVVVPCLAIDDRGYRIGYGAGFYDRCLPRFCPPAFAVAVAYDYQLLVEVPNTSRDVAVAAVVTDTRTLRVAGG